MTNAAYPPEAYRPPSGVPRFLDFYPPVRYTKTRRPGRGRLRWLEHSRYVSKHGIPGDVWMKIAVTGKGGVGKTLLSAFLSQMFADAGYTVTAIDADPDANLAATLGFPNPENIVPISELSDLIEERVGVKPGTSGGFFALNPRVDDIPGKYSVKKGNIRLMVMGRIKRGGTGCYCAEGSLV